MDNLEDLRMLPRDEQLVRLLEMSARFGVHLAASVRGPLTPSQHHQLEYGHPLRFGCCKGLPDVQAAA